MPQVGSRPRSPGTIVSLRPSKLDALNQEGAPPLAANAYYCDEEGHFKERCPTRLKDFLKQRADKGNRRPGRSAAPTGNRNFRATSPAARKKQVKFAEANQTLPVVAESYGRRRIAAIAEEAEPSDLSGGQDLLADVDLARLDEATVAALYEELQQPDLSDGELDFPDGQ